MDSGSGPVYISSRGSDSPARRSNQLYSSSPLSQTAMTAESLSYEEPMLETSLRRGSEWLGGPLDVSVAGPSHPRSPKATALPLNPDHPGRKRSHSTSPKAMSRAQLASPERKRASQADIDPFTMNQISSVSNDTRELAMRPPPSPSSAPATPSLLALTHPSPFIHTHHPKRSSPTPLSLNLISPVGPMLASAGTSPPTSLLNDRRSSAASSRRDYASSIGPRRSSLTPSLSTLAAANTTKAHVYASTPELAPSSTHRSSTVRTEDSKARHPPSQPLLQEIAAAHMQGRRGSMPHIGGYGASRFLPSLPPQRPSGGDEGAFEGLKGFRFGSGSSQAGESSTQAQAAATAALFPFSLSPSSDVFEQAEAEEAEKQRRAFLDATFGAAGKRARERLSIGGAGGQGTGTPRRESLMLWNQFGWSTNQGQPVLDIGELGAGPSELGGRRGSLPVAIPWNGSARLSKKEQKRRDEEEREVERPSDEGVELRDDDNEYEEDDDEEEEDAEELASLNPENGPLKGPIRPLPPLLPLSDPGPRLLPSTLALHRANHLLNARNLEAEPLPHPLPPSLHPPAPVDLAEFDIDFILAGSQTQLGRDKRKDAKSSRRPSEKSGGRDRHENVTGSYPPTPTLQLGRAGEEEDSFAKFVGEFDDEYGGRRGDWTFRACPPAAPSQGASDSPVSLSGPFAAVVTPKAEWDSPGAGRYELYATGEVLSVNTGRTWRVRRTASREYELERVPDLPGRLTPPGMVHRATTSSAESSGLSTDSHIAPACVESGTTYVLAAKLIHREQGGVKAPAGQRKGSGASTPRSARGSRTQSSFMRNRFGSEDSAGTIKPISRSFPLEGRMTTPPEGSTGPMPTSSSRRNSVVAKVKARNGHSQTPLSQSYDSADRAVDGLSSANVGHKESPRDRRQRTKDEIQEEKASKKDRSFSSVIKRGWLASINRSAAELERKERREDREREKMQSQSWSGASSSSSTWSNQGGNLASPSLHPTHLLPDMASSRRDTEAWTRDLMLAGSPRGSTDIGRSLGIEDELNGGLPWQEGKAWSDVPEEAVAMVIPLEGCPCLDKMEAKVSSDAESVKQALLVYFVPFNSLQDNRTTFSSPAPPPSSVNPAPIHTSTSHRLLHGAKLLRRKGSRDKELTQQRDSKGLDLGPLPLQGQPAGNFILHPLPFRSFRLVARVVDMSDLQSEPTTPEWAGFSALANNATVASTKNAPNGESSVPSGRNFPTVIAVCHSRSQGVEFVLEGLDRLGLCEGQSAWGPTGYEEWRGSGLSEEGREVLDLLWAGCTGVMGLSSG